MSKGNGTNGTSEPWLTYQLRKLVFHGTPGTLNFRGGAGQMLYNEADQIVAIRGLNTPQTKVAEILGALERNGRLPDLKTIYYDMKVDGHPSPLRFYHRLQRGARVHLEEGDRVIFIRNQYGRPIFSKEYMLRDVSRGTIDSPKHVWQFHGYKHEH